MSTFNRAQRAITSLFTVETFLNFPFSIVGIKQFDGFNEAYGVQTYKCSESEDDDYA